MRKNLTGRSGKIITFYSYKGGAGRSMALANTACLLGRNIAERSKKVLIIDWDLEAPGLHRYFPIADEGQYANRAGLIDYFSNLAQSISESQYKKIESENGEDELNRLFPLGDCIIPNVAEGVDLIKAGRFNAGYAELVASFNWVGFYSQYRIIFERIKEYITNNYSWCLIDSRTGLSDVSGICTMLMPEKLVAVFTLNRQSLEGVLDLVQRAGEYRRISDDPRPLAVFPLPSRIVLEEHKLLRSARLNYRHKFQECLRKTYGIEECDLATYFDEVEIPHIGFYTFNDLVPTRDDPGATDALSINKAYDRFYERLVTLDFSWESLEAARRSELIDNAEEIYLSLSTDEQITAKLALTRFVRVALKEEGSEDTGLTLNLSDFDTTVLPVVKNLADEGLLTIEKNYSSDQEIARITDNALIKYWPRFREWLIADREFLLWRQKLRQSIAEWSTHKQPDSRLLKGAYLVEANDWLFQRNNELNQAERTYIELSEAANIRSSVSGLFGKCINFGHCSIADSGKGFQIINDENQFCPECGNKFKQEIIRNRFFQRPITFGALILVTVIISASLSFWYWKLGSRDTVILRLHGSNTLGSKLIPALAQAFLVQQGAKNVRIVQTDKEDEINVTGVIPGESIPKTIEVKAHGTKTAFEALRDNTCDIGLASRQINQDEVRMLSGFGDMTLPTNENIVGLDGIAIIVNQSNKLSSLSVTQVKDIFTGKITSWRELGGPDEHIQVYARDDRSGTYDFFKTRVLNNDLLVKNAVRYEDSGRLSDDVSSDSNGIGFIALPFVNSAKKLAISEKGTLPLFPTPFTLVTEDYPLTRRLFLYILPNPQNAYARDFIEFALSKPGQDVVASNDFIAQTVVAGNNNSGGSEEFKKLTLGASRLSTSFRFIAGSDELDNKALVDLDRVVRTLKDLNYTGSNVIVLGFSDSSENPLRNKLLSQVRANAVAEQFRGRGVTPSVVVGLGPQNPVASNDTLQGREKNRRVEVWVRQ